MGIGPERWWPMVGSGSGSGDGSKALALIPSLQALIEIVAREGLGVAGWQLGKYMQ